MEELKNLVQKQQVTFVVGTGVTIGATGQGKLSWAGLISDALDRIELQQMKESDWIAMVRNELQYGLTKGDASSLSGAATKVSGALGGPESGEFKSWLRESFDGVEVTDSSVIQAIGATELPILTTNYDDVLERTLGRSATTWMDPADLSSVISGRSNEIGHLYGFWRQPASLIFSDQSYGSIMSADIAQQIQRAVATTSSMVFVGCGAGLADPNFGALLDWVKTYLVGTEIFHYRVGLESERPPFDPSSPVKFVSMGEQHSDLAGFLQELTATGADVAPALKITSLRAVASKSVESMCDHLRSETVLADHLPNADTATTQDLVVAPVLLPVTHEQFVKSQDLPEDQRFHRCDADEEARRRSPLLVVGDQRSGVSTTLRWLLSKDFDHHGDSIPIFIDFRSIGKGLKPLRKLIVRELRMSGHELQGDAIPPISLALDNLAPRPEKIFDRVVSELADLPIEFLVLGTRIGQEVDLDERLKENKLDCTVRYIGRLNTGDITSLAALVAPQRARQVAIRAVDIINQEHLPRTPFTVGLLVSALLHGEAFLATSSESALLDAYVSLLLGRGDPHDDARFTLDAYERGEILKELAKLLVHADSASLPEHVVAEKLQEYFDSIDWSEDPMEVLFNLRGRHVIRISAGHVSFSQASYLHLFAAKAASSDAGVRQKIFSRPLHYAAIVRHYAALERGDENVLRMVAGLVAASTSKPTQQSRNFYTEIRDRVLDAESIEELLATLEADPDFEIDDDGQDDGGISPPEDPLDHRLDEDREPFPVDRIEDAPPLPRIMATLTLVSNVLRDSEMVTDLELKQRVLAQTLAVWGRLVELLEDDAPFVEFVKGVAERIIEAHELSGTRAERLLREMTDSAAVLVGLGGMHSTLATRKLSRSLRRCFEDDEFMSDPANPVMGALLGFGIEGTEWPELFAKAQSAYPKAKAVDTVMTSLAEAAYYFQRLSENDKRELEEFVANQYVRRAGVSDSKTSKAIRGRVKQGLQRNRTLQESNRLGHGETVLTEPAALESRSKRKARTEEEPL